MKKTHRAVLSILLVLALLTALPLTAMAEDADYNGPYQETSVSQGDTLTKNEGKVTTNAGTIKTNQVYNTPAPRLDAGYIENNTGTVKENVGGGYIKNNQSGAVVEKNSGSGTIKVPDENDENATKYVNVVSTVENNYGTVNENSSGKLDGSNSQAGIVNNYGKVELNDYDKDKNQMGVIKYNADTGTVQTNKGFIGHSTDDGELPENTGNAGYVGENYGFVWNDGGTVQENKASRADYPNKPAEVVNSSGKVVDNYGSVWNDGGTVTNNKAGGYVCNEAGGTVTNNSGYVGNAGKVEINNVDGIVYSYTIYGDDWNIIGYKEGTIGTNYGTYEIYTSTNPSDPPTTTYYGVHYENDQGEKVYLGQFEEGDDVKVEDLKNTRKGWKITGIEKVEDYSWREKTFVEHDEEVDDGAEETPSTTNLTSFKISAPTLLKLVWEKITSVFTPASTASSGGDGAEVVELSTGKRYIGIGSVIFINEKPYKIIELKADSYVVVSFDALSDEDVKDLDTLFLSLFTPEQQALIKNYNQLLDAEDVLTVFGKPGNHPVYEVNKSLVQ